MPEYLIECSKRDLGISKVNNLSEAKRIKRKHERNNDGHRVDYYPVLNSTPIKNKINQIRHFIGLEVIDWG